MREDNGAISLMTIFHSFDNFRNKHMVAGEGCAKANFSVVIFTFTSVSGTGCRELSY